MINYFDRKNSYVTEPYARKLDRNNQKILLNKLTDEAKQVKQKIIKGEVGGKYFENMSNPHVSHFHIPESLEEMLSSLELNFLVTKYHEMIDKSGKRVVVYCFNYGLCEELNLNWGYPNSRRDDRSYFVQRCFSYSAVIHQFLASTQTIKCDNCEATFPIEDKEKFEFFSWVCKECMKGKCSIISLSTEYTPELTSMNNEFKLEEVEFDILEVLNSEAREMRAGEISVLIDKSHQLIGLRTKKLQENDLVSKRDASSGRLSKITDRAIDIYFSG